MIGKKSELVKDYEQDGDGGNDGGAGETQAMKPERIKNGI